MVHIYLITNEITGKYYVGQTYTSVEKRFKKHIQASKKEKSSCRKLCNSIRKYGHKCFSIQTLISKEVSSKEEGNALETLWITALDAVHAGYNICPEGNTSAGVKRTEETLRNMSEAQRGKTPWNKGLKTPLEVVRKLSAAKRGNSNRKGKKASLETCKRLSEAHLGQKPWNTGLKLGPLSEETRKKISDTLLRKTQNGS